MSADPGLKELEELEALLVRQPGAWRRLWRFLYHEDGAVRRRAAGAFGRAVARQSEDRPELAREVLRRLFWGMNEESGSVCWGAPEAAGEILRHRPELCGDFVPLLVSLLSDPALRRGVLRALARLGPECAGEGAAREAFRSCLEDPEVRNAIAALGYLAM
ncbi:MAG: DVU0298 family protein [Desulfotomaculales bacterium]